MIFSLGNFNLITVPPYLVLSEIRKNSTLNRRGKKSPPLKKKARRFAAYCFQNHDYSIFFTRLGIHLYERCGALPHAVGGCISQTEQKPALILLLDCCSVHTTRSVLITRNEDTFSWLRIVYIPAKYT